MVTLTYTPDQYTTANNPIVFNFSSDTATTLFNVVLKEASTQTTVYTGNAYPTPLAINSAGINLQKLLAPLVISDVENVDAIMLGKPKNYIGYQVSIVDNGVSGGTLVPLSTGVTSSTFYTYEAQLDNFNFTNYTSGQYLMGTGYTGSNFLTVQPDLKVVNEYSSEQLYFITDGTLNQIDLAVQVTGTTYTIPYTGTTTPAISSTVTIPFTGAPSTSTITSIQIIQPAASHIVYSGTVSYTGGINDYLTALVPLINANTYGYVASVTSSTSLTITAPASLGAVQNTYPCYISFGGGGGYIGIFSGGVNPSTQLEKVIRVQASPKFLVNSIAGIAGNSYSVWLQDSVGDVLSEVRTYNYQQPDCDINYINVVFTNSLGGVDTIQLIQPVESIEVARLNIKKNNINTTDSSVFLGEFGGFNVQNSTYDVTSKSTIKAYTKTMSNEYSNWLIELVKSKNVFIETLYSDLVPVQLKATTFNIDQTRFKRTEPIQYQFEFMFDDNFNPATSLGETIIFNS